MKNNLFNYLLNGLIILFLIIVAYFGFNLVNNSLKSEKEIKEITDTSKTLTSQPNLTIQLEVQNGSGENGIAVRFTDYLRKNNMDVVEIGNYKSQDVAKTLVIDRSGDNIKARKVAQILGVSERSIIQQINNSLYLDVTVVIGKDFKELKPFLEKKK
ncbi:MAG: LytR C-terminal domain-containing protein [Ignavibacteria bacterium]|nr:LytR C-terminal domain-containing protein [Ignavibacteria bacterium]